MCYSRCCPPKLCLVTIIIQNCPKEKQLFKQYSLTKLANERYSSWYQYKLLLGRETVN